MIAFCVGSQASACTCGALTVTQQRENASAIFSGTVVKMTRSDAVEKNGVEITFKVDRIWKGRDEETTLIYTGATGDLYPFKSTCAPSFRVGQQYIVFAVGADKPSTDTCTGTFDYHDAKNLKRELGRSARPKSKRKNALP